MNRSLIIILIAITVAAPFLEEAQREVLTSSQEQIRSMQEINMNMGLQFMKSARTGE